MDLAKFGQIKHLSLVFRETEALDRIVNEVLDAGWVIASMKIVEERSTIREGDKHLPCTQVCAYYILGKPRLSRPDRPGAGGGCVGVDC